jgi:tetratricopeptide (TPR) repeat protein
MRIFPGLMAIITIIVAGIYGFTISAPFYSDDYIYIVNNQRLRNLPLGELWRLATEKFNPFEYLPLRDLSYRLDLALFGLNPTGFRFINVLLYLLTCGLVFIVTRRACEALPPKKISSATAIAAITSLLFCLHPAHVEAVVWISGRKDLMAACFALVSLWAAIEAGMKSTFALRLIALTSLTFIAALMSKAITVALMPIYIGLAWRFYGQAQPTLSKRDAILHAGLPAISAMGFLYLFHNASTVTIPQYYGWESIARFFAIIGWLARLAISPEPRYTFYPVFESDFALMVSVGIIAIAMLLGGIFVAYRCKSLMLFPLAMLFCLAIPYGQILPFGTHSLVADRFLFLLSWPVCFMLAIAASTHKRQVSIALFSSLWAYQASSYALVWRDNAILRERVLSAYPRHYGPINVMVFAQMLPKGQFIEAAKLIENIEDNVSRSLNLGLLSLKYNLALDTDSNTDPGALMAQIWQMQQSLAALPEEAKWNISYRYLYDVSGKEIVSQAWDTLAARYPKDPAIHFNAGLWFHEIRDDQHAAKMFGTAVNFFDQQSQYYGVALKRYGISSWYIGDLKKAEDLLTHATSATVPDPTAFCILGKYYKANGRVIDATEAVRQCPKSAGQIFESVDAHS